MTLIMLTAVCSNIECIGFDLGTEGPELTT